MEIVHNFPLQPTRESLKTEMKLLKHEVELLPKERRKEALRYTIHTTTTRQPFKL